MWLRGGFEWTLNDNVTIRNQAHEYGTKRHWFDSETYAFNTATSLIDRDRFFVTHKQQVVGQRRSVPRLATRPSRVRRDSFAVNPVLDFLRIPVGG